MAALGGSRHALINLSTQIDIPPIIKKSLSPATGYFGHKDEQSHHLNTFYVSFASVCALQMGAFCILQNFFQRNFCFRPAFEKVVCIITRKGEVLPPFDRKEVRTWNLIAENFKSNVPFKVSVNGCCTTKRATPTTKSGDAGNGKYRFNPHFAGGKKDCYPAVLFRGHDRRGNRKDVQYVAQHDTVQTDKLF